MKDRHTAMHGCALPMVLMLLMAFPALVSGQNLPCRTYGLTGNEACQAIVQANDRGFVLAGWSTSFSTVPTDSNILIVRTDSLGVPVKAVINAMPNSGPDVITSMVKTLDGGYVLCGYTRSFTNGYDVVVMKLTALLGQQWCFVYNSSYNGDDLAYSIIQTADGAYTLTGSTRIAGTTAILVMRLDVNGVFRRAWCYSRSGLTAPQQGFGICDLFMTAPKYAIVGRYWNPAAGNWDAFVMRIDTLGNIIPPTVCLPGTAGDDEAWSVLWDGTTIAAAGWTRSFGPGAPDYANIWLWKLPLVGTGIWRTVYGWSQGDERVIDDRSLVSVTDGYVLTGFTRSVGQGLPQPNFLIMKVDPNGLVKWARVHPSDTARNAADEGYPMFVTHNGFAAAGWTNSFGFGGQDFHLVTLDNQGNRPRCVISVRPDTSWFTEDTMRFVGATETFSQMVMSIQDTMVLSLKVCTAAVVRHDVGVRFIEEPTDAIDSNTVVVPACSVYNYGTETENYTVRMKIGSGYNTQANVVGHIPGTMRRVTFANWVAGPRGTLIVSCSTELGSDIDPANDRLTGTVTVRVNDVGVTEIVAPTGTIDSGTVITPACSVYNYGNRPAGFNVRMKIGPYYDNVAAVPTLLPGTKAYVTFSSWAARPGGQLSVSCSTELTGDMVPANDKKTGRITVRRRGHDASVLRLTAPVGIVDSGTPVIPACSVYNYGEFTESYTVRMKIGSSYNQVVSVSNHSPLTAVYVNFPVWIASPPGILAVSCSTELNGDAAPDNDRATGLVNVRRHGPDVGAIRIVAPKGVYYRGTSITPRCSTYNYGDSTVSYYTHLRIGSVYHESVLVSTHSPGSFRELTFPNWTATPTGNYAIKAYTGLSGDANPGNDTATEQCLVIRLSLWERRADVPAGPRSKKVKDGGCLAAYTLNDTDFVYCLKGNNRLEFYRYNHTTNTWATLESVPAVGGIGKRKGIKKGAVLVKLKPGACPGGLCYAFAAKGNNTLEWWLYDPTLVGSQVYPWQEKTAIPSGASPVKEGSGATSVTVGDTTFVFFLKGSGTQEFYRYDVRNNQWQTMAPAPLGASGKPFKKGSALADGDPYATKLYALKGGVNEFYEYDIATNTWTTKASLPLIGNSGRKKKAGDGAELAYAGGNVYCLKGGNTNEFWQYEIGFDRWVQLVDLPEGEGKRVKGGGALTHAFALTDQTVGNLYALKGNNTLEFYDYPLTDFLSAKPATPNTVSRAAIPAPGLVLHISPNPFADATTVSYSLPQAGSANLKLYDVTGKLVATLASGYHQAGSHRAQVAGDKLASGIYLLKLEFGNATTTAKLIVE